MEQAGHEPGRRLNKVGRGKLWAIIAGAVVFCLLGGYLILCAFGQTENRILPHTRVMGIDLGGMTRERAEQILFGTTISQAEGRSVVFCVAGEENFIEDIPASSVQVDCSKTAELALTAGKDTGFLGRGAVYLHCMMSGQDVTPVFAAESQLDVLLKDIDEQLSKPVEESSWFVGDTQLEITKGMPGYQVDRESLKKIILDRLGKTDTVETGTVTAQFTVNPVYVEPQELDFQKMYDSVHVEMRNAAIDQAADSYQMEVTGVDFDLNAAKAAFAPLDWGETCKVDLIFTKPEITVQDLGGQLFGDLLGSCSTNIGGTANRLSNVKLAASFCNEKILLPGEVFSYNGTVGRRTTGRGFLSAPAYVGGQTVSEIGGGICQVSSTVYLASLRANMEIVERYNHIYAVGYVPNGMDATVYYGSKDFRFKNNRNYPVKIVTRVSSRTLSVKVYGTKRDNITVEMESIQRNKKGYKTIYQIDRSLSRGKTRVSVTPYSGCTVEVYRCLYENGIQVSRLLESKNIYKSRDKVILVSPADAARYGLAGSKTQSEKATVGIPEVPKPVKPKPSGNTTVPGGTQETQNPPASTPSTETPGNGTAPETSGGSTEQPPGTEKPNTGTPGETPPGEATPQDGTSAEQSAQKEDKLGPEKLEEGHVQDVAPEG